MNTTTTQPTTTKHRPINSHQLQLLTTLYKFRYATAQIIASSQGAKHTRVILTRLKILVDQGYIGQNYDKSYKIIGKPANYFLLPKGIQILRQQPFVDPNVLKQAYYDKNKDDGHIQHRLNVFRAYVFIKHNYRKQFQFFSKTELPNLEYKLPRDLTDAYLQKNEGVEDNGGTSNPKLANPDYFLSFYEAIAPYWRIRNSIRRYITYAESEKWQKASERDFPVVLVACGTKVFRTRLRNLIKREQDKTWATVVFEFLIIDQQ